MKIPALALSALMALGTGCVAGGDDSCDDSEKCDQPGGNGSLIMTFNGNAQLYAGYHTLFDKTSSQCVTVDKDIANGAQINVGAVNETLDLTAVTSREELATELGVDLGLKVKYLTTDADATMNMVRKTKSTSTSVNLLLKVSQSYIVRNRHPMMITDAGQAKLDAGADRFVQTCGTHYINGVRYSGDLFLLISYDAKDEQTALDVKASLGIKGGSLGAASVDGEMKTRLQSAANLAGVSVTVRVTARGFDLAGSTASPSLVSEFLGDGVNAQTFAKIDEIRSHMEKSVQNDACRDAGEGQCDGVASPGYFDNLRRSAQPSGVDIGFYDALANVEFGADNPFKAIKERLHIIERFIRDWAELEERMEVVYWNEIDPFLKATASQKAGYQIAPPGKPLRSPNELLDVSNQWMNKFFPEVGTQIGFTFEIVSNKVRDCWQNASVEFATQCAENDTPGIDMPEWRMVEDEIKTYAAQARILPLQFKTTSAVAHRQIVSECSKLSTSDISYRAPTQDEVELLAPLVGFGAIEWPSDRPHQIWFNHTSPSSVCANPDFPNPFYNNDPAAGSSEIRCGAPDGIIFDGPEMNVICVPSGGPLPLPEAP